MTTSEQDQQNIETVEQVIDDLLREANVVLSRAPWAQDAFDWDKWEKRLGDREETPEPKKPTAHRGGEGSP